MIIIPNKSDKLNKLIERLKNLKEFKDLMNKIIDAKAPSLSLLLQ